MTWPPLALALLAASAPPDPLIYCGDQEGGGPFIFPSPQDPDTVIGSDVDVAAALARRLGRPLRFQQGQWDRLLDLVRARKCDLVINAYERTPARAEVLTASLPYQVYALALLVRRDGPAELDLATLTDPEGPARRVGVLSGSSADTWLRERAGPRVEVVGYDGNTDAMREVETGKLDATLQDTPIAHFYAPRFPRLEQRGEPVAPGYYVIYGRDPALIAAVDAALLAMIADGELAEIMRRYDAWDSLQVELESIVAHAPLFGRAVATSSAATTSSAAARGLVAAAARSATVASSSPPVVGERPRGLEVVRRYGGVLLRSAGLTVVLSVLSFPLAIALGLLVALGRLYGPRAVALPLGVYVEVLRGTPLMLQLYFVFFLLPELGLNIPAFATAILGLAVNYSAYESEIYRAGIQAVPPGQLEAALSLGMSRAQALRHVVVPQAVRAVIPPVMNDFIALFKDTSVCSVVTLVELTKRFSVLSQSTQATVELMSMTALLYLAMSWPAARASRWVERRLGVEVRR